MYPNTQIIEYPIFTLPKKPFDIVYTTYQIRIKKTESSSWETLDDRSYGGDYFTRLLQLEYRVAFDYTCGNLQDLILSSSRWGVDSAAKIHEIPSFNTNKTTRRKIVRTNKNFIWVKYVSYPFQIKTTQDLDFNTDNLFADLIMVDKKWFIKGFTNEEN